MASTNERFERSFWFLSSRASLLLVTAAGIVGCQDDPLKDWSNSKLNSKAAECAGMKKHNPRSGVICSQVLESCSFRGISCR